MPPLERALGAKEDGYAGLPPKQAEVLRRNAFKPGNSGSSPGTNRWTAAQRRFRELMAQEIPDDPEGRSRFDMTILATYDSSLLPGPKGALDRRLIIEQICGKARDNPGNLDFAEHFRQVEADRIRTVVSVLGPKLRDKTPVQLAEFFRECANDPSKFLTQAGQVMGEQSGESSSAVPEGARDNGAVEVSPKGRDMADHASPVLPVPSGATGDDFQEFPEQKPEGEP